MLKSKLAIISVCFWIFAGCQQSFHATTSEQSINTQGLSASGLEPFEQSSKRMNGSKSSTQSGLDDSEKSDLVESENPSDQENGDSDLFAQQKIDEALELCNSAQEMWEEGKIEDALSNLDDAYASIMEIETETYPEFYQQKEDVRYLISKRILEIYASRQTVANGPHNEIPLTMNNFVQDEINSLTGPERNFFIQSLERSQRYRPYIISELKKAGLPEEISWLPLIESGFKLRALSSARALGLWQFIPSTGYKFGLNRNHYIDERMDPEKATLAAINYLKELHGLFGDWTTALAAYNCGEGRVLGTIRTQKINYLDNFWDLYQKLPRETARYVPRFLATLHIINNLEKYNICLEQPLSPIPYRTCEITNQVRLSDIADEIGVEAAVLQDLNPELRYAMLPDETYQLRVPEEKAELFLSKADSIKSTYSPQPKAFYTIHRVQKRETLFSIAEKYKTTPEAIIAANNLGKARKLTAGRKLRIPDASDDQGTPKTATRPAKPEKAKTVQKYTVQRGDNLWAIAEKFNTTTKNIMAENKLSGTTLTVGQSLTIASGKQISPPKETVTRYKVKNGDSPLSIAKKYKIPVDRLLALNHLSKKSKIFPGQNLIVQ
ncbi:MAG: lytic transglycosylase [Desulfobacula sp. RIFOXYA12_FULL_46_16]|nr:MAG: lytic transglycosylase [Desulfobacula sp. RIFOXYA12_FULL_46_16]